ncbi:MAG: serine/threonine protein kinase [Deltaproteobacteria bacterium]|nr:serine/threonine protein kinase [Deltaproteobacteria bacterium]
MAGNSRPNRALSGTSEPASDQLGRGEARPAADKSSSSPRADWASSSSPGFRSPFPEPGLKSPFPEARARRAVSGELEPIRTKVPDGFGLPPELYPTGWVTADPVLRPAAVEVGPRYQLRSPLGESSTCTAFAAQHVGLDRKVTMKILKAELAKDPEQVERLRREARALARTRHPGIVEALDFDATPDGRPFVVMERLKGESLASRISRPSDLAEALELGCQICEALAAAHLGGVIHGDLRPETAFLVRAGTQQIIKLVDFQVFVDGERPKAEEAQRSGFACPEGVSGAALTTRSDVYGAALLVYSMLAGRNPFHSPANLEATKSNISTLPPPPLPEGLHGSLGPEVFEVLARGLAKRPEDRWPSAQVFGDALAALNRRCKSSSSLPAPGPTAVEGALSGQDARRVSIAAAACGFVAAFAAGVVITFTLLR